MTSDGSRWQQVWTDAGGVSHDPKVAHTRIVSLVPSLTETLCAVGGRAQLVGCTAFCIRPEGLLKDPAVAKVGGTKTLVKDRILKLNPGLMLLNLEENTLEDIDYFKSRVECYVNGVKTLRDGIATIRELAALIGTSAQAEPLATEAETKLAEVEAQVAQQLAKGAARPKVFYAIWRDPWMTTNRDTFIHAQLESCGARNIFASENARYPVVTLEQVRAAAPEIVWLPSEPFRFKEKHIPDFNNLPGVPAAQNGRIELVDGDNVCWFGVRQIEGTPYTYRQLWDTK